MDPPSGEPDLGAGNGKHCTSIFAKVDLPPDENHNRRVLAVLAYPNS